MLQDFILNPLSDFKQMIDYTTDLNDCFLRDKS